MRLDETAIAEQVFERIGKALGLIKPGTGNLAAGTDDRVAGADEDVGAGVDWTRAILQFTGEAVMHAAELRLLRLPQVEVGEQPPNPDR